jgi:hypothetical protein
MEKSFVSVCLRQVRNGKIGQCIMLSSDVRRLTMGKNKPDGGPPDLEHAINMMVFEVTYPNDE